MNSNDINRSRMLRERLETYSLAVPHLDCLVVAADDALARQRKRPDVVHPASMAFKFDPRYNLKLIIKLDNRCSVVSRGQEQATISRKLDV